jgi:hypothetical protein
MSLQGPLIVVAERPAPDLVQALSLAGAFPIIETNWADAPTAFISVNPAAIIIAEPGAPPSESAARMLCLQAATASGPIVPIIARVDTDTDAAVPIALPNDASLPIERLMARLQSAMRVRALHATVLRRIEMFTAQDGKLPSLPVGDALEDATVLIAGRGPLYPVLSVAMGERVGMVGALSVEAAEKYLKAHDIDGIVVGDGFSPRMIETFLTMVAQDTRFRDIPVALIGEAPADFFDSLRNIDHVAGDPALLVARMVPLVRMHAFEARLKRMLKSLDADGMFDPRTGLLTQEAFAQDLARAIDEAADRGQPLSLARIGLGTMGDERASLDGARLLTRLTRVIDFACRDENGSLVVAFTQTDISGAHVVARRMAGVLKNMVMAQRGVAPAADVTLATLKDGDTLDSLMRRVNARQPVAVG